MKAYLSVDRPLAVIAAAALVLASMGAQAAEGIVEGPVVSQSGNNVVVRTEKGDVTLTVNESTYIG